MKISTTIGFDGDPQRLVQQAKDFESAGVDLLWGARRGRLAREGRGLGAHAA